MRSVMTRFVQFLKLMWNFFFVVLPQQIRDRKDSSSDIGCETNSMIQMVLYTLITL